MTVPRWWWVVRSRVERYYSSDLTVNRLQTDGPLQRGGWWWSFLLAVGRICLLRDGFLKIFTYRVVLSPTQYVKISFFTTIPLFRTGLGEDGFILISVKLFFVGKEENIFLVYVFDISLHYSN